MREIDVTPPPSDPTSFVVSFASRHGLRIVSEGSLKGYPGCVHWHLRKPGVSGTLEATWWPAKKRFWLKVARNRTSLWIDEALDSERLA